jgi:probable F420-dependent oxidoreductase
MLAPVRFAVQLPTDRVDRGDEFDSGEAVAQMARAAEAAAFDGCFVTDHPFPGDRWLAAGGHHALDPFVALSFAAAATSRIRLLTNVVVLPYRNPFLTAKAAASLDVLSGGRLVLGVAAGYLKSEFAALGVAFEERNARVDEALVALRRAWTEQGVTMRGSHFEARGNSMLPRPLQRPHPPIWVGGNSRLSIRRAVEHAQGWNPFPTAPSAAPHVRTAVLASISDLEQKLAYLRDHARAVGRSAPLDVCFTPFGLDRFSEGHIDADALLETLAQLAKLGITWASIVLPAASRAAWCERVAGFGEAVIARLAG